MPQTKRRLLSLEDTCFPGAHIP